ncbi:MAG: hypothetical protein HGB08_01940 [Candidatus Moranbacteria bacterium]|nr:hypothetical protein [Candidatus Moranbacteria bacterium]
MESPLKRERENIQPMIDKTVMVDFLDLLDGILWLVEDASDSCASEMAEILLLVSVLLKKINKLSEQARQELVNLANTQDYRSFSRETVQELITLSIIGKDGAISLPMRSAIVVFFKGNNNPSEVAA